MIFKEASFPYSKSQPTSISRSPPLTALPLLTPSLLGPHPSPVQPISPPSIIGQPPSSSPTHPLSSSSTSQPSTSSSASSLQCQNLLRRISPSLHSNLLVLLSSLVPTQIWQDPRCLLMGPSPIPHCIILLPLSLFLMSFQVFLQLQSSLSGGMLCNRNSLLYSTTKPRVWCHWISLSMSWDAYGCTKPKPMLKALLRGGKQD